MKNQLIIVFVFFPILLFAEWPTGLGTGLQLSNDPDHYEWIKSYCADGEGGFYICIENEGHLYINHINHNGEVRWPMDYPQTECFTDQDDGFQLNNFYKRGFTVMACNDLGEVWVAWSDFRHSNCDEYYDPTRSEVYIQKFNQNRIAQWETETGRLVHTYQDSSISGYVNDFRSPGYLEPQSDGSILILWTDTDQDWNNNYQGNHWVQRFDSDGNALFEEPGIRMIPDTEWGSTSNCNIYISDGIGGVMFNHGQNVLRILPSGELAWEYGASEIDRIRYFISTCEGLNNTTVFTGYGWPQNNENDIVLATAIDTSGNIVHDPVSIGNPEDEYPVMKIGKCGLNSYGIMGINDVGYPFFLINHEFQQISEPQTITHFTSALNTLIISEFGYRNITNQSKRAVGYDENGNFVYDLSLDENRFNVYKPLQTVDESGNTWVFWTVGEYDGDLYANVISPDGQWGIASNDVDSPFTSPIIPPDISLNVYPNPGNGQFNISFDLVNPSPTTFILTNVLGQRIYSYQLPRNAVASGTYRGTLPLNLNDQASGIYLLQVRTESGHVEQSKIFLLK